MELQEKLSPCSCEAIFMGYPPGVKAWRCRDAATSVFFNSRDVVFDEAFTNCPFPDSDDDEDDENPTIHRAPVPAPTPTPVVKVILKGNGSEGLQPQLIRCAPFPSIAPYFRML
jgi:hypothetical protein